MTLIKKGKCGMDREQPIKHKTRCTNCGMYYGKEQVTTLNIVGVDEWLCTSCHSKALKHICS